ncbi:hypothetical protein Taro_051866 [Colocasia esculenta]|uniref:Uncharacterized protein n=1 Tax=Colocasia esculenta TaxID=4460 RepID=A0A843XH00_COLES|nr:hypothetical protein [Colocasia esculenta]
MPWEYAAVFKPSIKTRSIPPEEKGGISRFYHGSVDIVPGSVDTSPNLQKTQLPDWDSVSTQSQTVSTQSQAVSTLVSVPRRTVLQKWDNVSTHSLT